MKRFFYTVMTVLLVVVLCGTAAAAEYSTYASLSIREHNARIQKGNSPGTINISYYVKSSKIADSLGVSSISVYTSDGRSVAFITGNIRNGLVHEDDRACSNIYSCELEYGTSYYAEVTLFATAGDTTDQRVVITDTITAP